VLCGRALTHNALEEREHGGVALCLQEGKRGLLDSWKSSFRFFCEARKVVRAGRRQKKQQGDMEASQFVPFKFLLKADGPKVVADLFVACYAQRFAKPYPAQLLEAASTALKISQTEADQVCVTKILIVKGAN